MRVRGTLLVAIALLATSFPAWGQIGGLLGGGGPKKVLLRRVLPPAVELEARPFSISARAQDKVGENVATSFGELLRAKIQGDSRFVLTEERSAALKISIVVTRFYLEQKSLARSGGAACSTYTGRLQGTFSVIDNSSGRPLASDALDWKLQLATTDHQLISSDGQEIDITPNEKLQPDSISRSTAAELPLNLASKVNTVTNNANGALSAASRLLGTRTSPSNTPPAANQRHPCDKPFSQNEAQDALADAFLTDIIHLAVKYESTVEVPLPGGKVKKMSDDAEKGNWSNVREQLVKLGQQPKPEDEADRMYLLALSNEALGYDLGKQVFETRQKIRPDSAPADTLRLQSEVRRMLDQAKDYFDEAAFNFNKASQIKKDDKDYLEAERRAGLSQKLYVRIKSYRDLKPEAAEVKSASLTIKDVVNMCDQKLLDVIIVDRIQRVSVLAVTPDDAIELGKCGTQQKAIYDALKARWDSGK